MVVDCTCSDEALWRGRLERRGCEEEGGDRAHKPGSWGQLQALLSRCGAPMRYKV